jgi:hypothetical protein
VSQTRTAGDVSCDETSLSDQHHFPTAGKKKYKKNHPGHEVSSVTNTQELEVRVRLVRGHNHSQKAPQAVYDPLSGLTPSLRVNLDTLKQSEIPTKLSTSPPSLLLTLQDNISKGFQPTTVPECASKHPVDLVAMDLCTVIMPCASDVVTSTVESTTIESIHSRVLHQNKASKTARCSSVAVCFGHVAECVALSDTYALSNGVRRVSEGL